MANETRIQDRIAGRKEAEELLSVRSMEVSEDWQRAFALAMRHFADSVLGPVDSSLAVMNEQQAKIFELRLVQFGIHRDKTYAEAPIDYLTWIADNASELASYLRSDRGKHRIENEESTHRRASF